MNIFATSKSPIKSAEFLDDQRVVKMILESCQMLSTAVHVVRGKNAKLLRPTHVNHPCNMWVRQSADNFLWLLEHAYALDAERQRRFKHSNMHKSILQLNNAKIWKYEKYFPDLGLQPFANCARNSSLGLDFTHVTPTIKAYRRYLYARWSLTPPRFTNCP